ncbi:unnamed protein product, partial [Coccothraustes coccothraustes]
MERRGGRRKRRVGLDPGQRRAPPAPPRPREGRAAPRGRAPGRLGGGRRPRGPRAARRGAGPAPTVAPSGHRAGGAAPSGSRRCRRGAAGGAGAGVADLWRPERDRPARPPRARSGPAAARCPRCLPGPSARGPRRCGIARPRPGRGLAGKWRFPGCRDAGSLGRPRGRVGNAERPGGALRRAPGREGPAGRSRADPWRNAPSPSRVFIAFMETDSCDRSSPGIRFRCFHLL